MFDPTNEVKVMRDPIHGYIHVDLQVVWDCINAREFQRLRRIQQLGGSLQVYHTAEHSRFSHSIGVYEIIRRMVNEIDGIKNILSDYEKATVMLAGLLHDVGHGPFSHAFEAVSTCKHEEFTCRIIEENTEIHQILIQADPSLPEDIAKIIRHRHPNELLNQMVSGQLDADRMDYLLRDAYFTGTSYGNFDLERILRTIRVVDNKMVVKESGIHTVEDYIMAHYHMYWQVYYHPTARSYESILELLFRRMKDLWKSNRKLLDEVVMFHAFLKDTPADVEEHYRLDEAAAFYGFSLLEKSQDPILKDLSSRLLNRHLFSYCTLENEADAQRIKQRLTADGYDIRYYFLSDIASQRPYLPYQGDGGQAIWVLAQDGRIVELSEISLIVKALCESRLQEDHKAFYPDFSD